MSETEEVTPPVSEAEAVRRREMLISVDELEAQVCVVAGREGYGGGGDLGCVEPCEAAWQAVVDG